MESQIEAHKPVDGLLGFSQGCMLATLLMGIRRREQALLSTQRPTEESQEGLVSQPSSAAQAEQCESMGGGASRDLLGGPTPLSFVILMSGIPPRSTLHKPLFLNSADVPKPLPIPSLHVIGKHDPFLQQSEKLVEMYDGGANRVVTTHDGGHAPPRWSEKACLEACARFVEDFHTKV